MVSPSFPSTHSSSAAALAMVISAWDPALRWPAWLFALGIGFGSIYSGGHYPADVLAGYAVGCVLGWALVRLGRFFNLGAPAIPPQRGNASRAARKVV
jgi:undecaprenyl-diphosphatase